MSEYKKILLATDFSDASSMAAKRAVALASCCEAELTVLHVVNYVPPAYIGVEMPSEYSSKKYMRNRAAGHLDKWVEENGLQSARKITETGPAKRTIVDVAGEIEADLVVVGGHGENGLARVFGSVAHAVAHHCPCDVLVVRSPK